MSSGAEFIRELAGIPRQVVLDQAQERFADGFNDAAEIAINTLSVKIDALMDTIRGGGSLSDVEQKVLATLTDIRLETETQFVGYWSEGTPAVPR